MYTTSSYYAHTRGNPSGSVYTTMLRAAAADRNKSFILNVLKSYVQDGMKVLEISSGTGQHCAYFGENFENVIWQPSEVDSRSLHSIVGYIDNLQLPNIRVPLFIDVEREVNRWALPAEFSPHQVDVILNINMIHISSNRAVTGLFKAAAGLLKRGRGLLITYGPYSIDGNIYPQSNSDFHDNLRAQNPEWGLRDTVFLEELANSNGMSLIARHEMPANNHMLIFRIN